MQTLRRGQRTRPRPSVAILLLIAITACSACGSGATERDVSGPSTVTTRVLAGKPCSMSAVNAKRYVTAFVSIIEASEKTESSRANALRLVDDLRACDRAALAERVAVAIDQK